MNLANRNMDGLWFWLTGGAEEKPASVWDVLAEKHSQFSRAYAEMLMRDITSEDLERFGRHVGEERKLEPRDDLSALELQLRKHRAEAVGFHLMQGRITGP